MGLGRVRCALLFFTLCQCWLSRVGNVPGSFAIGVALGTVCAFPMVSTCVLLGCLPAEGLLPSAESKQ